MCTNVYIHGCTCMYANVHTHKQDTYLYIQKNISRSQRFSQTINSNRKFTDTNPGIKKSHTPLKTTIIIKAINKNDSSHY